MKRAIILPLLCMATLVNGQDLPFYPQSGYWFDPLDPGTGLNFDIQNGILAGNFYGYDSEGHDAWLQFSGPLQLAEENQTYSIESDLIRFADGECLTQCEENSSDDSSSLVSEVVGKIKVSFHSSTTASISVNDSFVSHVNFYHFGVQLTTGDVPDRPVPDYTGDWTLVFESTDVSVGTVRRQSAVATFKEAVILEIEPPIRRHPVEITDAEFSDLFGDGSDDTDDKILAAFDCFNIFLPVEPPNGCRLTLFNDDDNACEDEINFRISLKDMIHNRFTSNDDGFPSGGEQSCGEGTQLKVIGHRLSYEE